MYEERIYRGQVDSKFKIELSFKESDLLICSDSKIPEAFARSILIKYYEIIEGYAKQNPSFLTSLSPLKEDRSAPDIIKSMLKASKLAGIGPLSCVAGAVASYSGAELLELCNEIVVENGGDVFCKINEDKHLKVYLGEKFSLKELVLNIKKRDYAFGIASSSAVIGHSLNFGKADLVTVIMKDAVVADSFATAISNKIKERKDVEDILRNVKDIPFIEGLLIAFEDNIFLWGSIEVAS